MVCPQRSARLRVDRFEPAVHARRSKPDRGRERAAPHRSPAPIPEWQIPGDPRAKNRIEDLLHMSSGLRIRAPQDPDCDPSGPYPDHLYLYTGGVDSYHYAATRPQQWPPNSVGRYRNTNPVLIS
jgi:CubicO group peptidase (beta-lactamase class C family)